MEKSTCTVLRGGDDGNVIPLTRPFRRNVSYGTILVDLQDHQVVDLLPDRSASSLESWLKSHPGVRLISRDRSGDYATGASKGAPHAVQVADRFHLQKNLSEAVERIFHRHREALQQIVVAGSTSSSALVAAPIPRPERKAQQEQTRSKRMQRFGSCICKEPVFPKLHAASIWGA